MRLTYLLPVAALATSLTTFSAEARIVCKNDYQVVQGNHIATPYCQDNYLARVAREYGVRVSDSEIRNNPNRKREVCRFVGRDIRVRENCFEDGDGRKGK